MCQYVKCLETIIVDDEVVHFEGKEYEIIKYGVSGKQIACEEISSFHSTGVFHDDKAFEEMF